MTSSLRLTFDREFEETRQYLYQLADMVGAAIDLALKSLIDRDLKLEEEIIANDVEIIVLSSLSQLEAQRFPII